MIQRYVSKISGPLLDRIDTHMEVPAVKYKELRAPSSSEDSALVRQRVIAARERQLERFHAEKKTYANAQMMPKMIRKHCAISADGEKLLENAITRLGLSARAHDRILKVARTIADLDASENIDPRHLSEAIQYRTLDRSYWALPEDNCPLSRCFGSACPIGRQPDIFLIYVKCSIDLGLASVLPIGALPWV
jgi:magnesium chelatase family protein